MTETGPERKPNIVTRVKTGLKSQFSNLRRPDPYSARMSEIAHKFSDEIQSAPDRNTAYAALSRSTVEMISVRVDAFMELYLQSPREVRESLSLCSSDRAEEAFKKFETTGKESDRQEGILETRVAAVIRDRIKTVTDDPPSIVDEYRNETPQLRQDILKLLEKNVIKYKKRYERKKKTDDLRHSQYSALVAQSLRSLIAELDTPDKNEHQQGD